MADIIRLIPKVIPPMIHGDPTPKNGYPTHTHGLEKVGLPEMFINASAFGPVVNAEIINSIFIFLYKHNDLFIMVQNKQSVEIQLWGPDELILCIRHVPNTFLGVRKAYFHDDLNCKTGFAQIYVKGDDHVLEDVYYEKIK